MNPPRNPVSLQKRVWAYGQELALTIAIQMLVVVIWGGKSLTGFVSKSAKDWAQLQGVLLAASLVIWGMYVNFTVGGFGDYLRKTGRDANYRHAFSMAILAPTAASITLVVAAYVDKTIVQHVAFFLLVYSLCNIYTMYRNIVTLSNYKRKFENLIDEAIHKQQEG